MQATSKVITISHAIQKIRVAFFASNRYPKFIFYAIPAKITNRITYRIFTSIHNFPSILLVSVIPSQRKERTFYFICRSVHISLEIVHSIAQDRESCNNLVSQFWHMSSSLFKSGRYLFCQVLFSIKKRKLSKSITHHNLPLKRKKQGSDQPFCLIHPCFGRISLHFVLKARKNLSCLGRQKRFLSWRYRPDLNWRMRVLQTLALPLGHGTV